mgnify:CR=1 FL=1
MSSGYADSLEPIEFLARSAARVETIESLLAAGTLDRPAINDRISASRSTITRTLSDFEDRGWVERHNGTYGLTPMGEVLGGEFLELLETVELAEGCSTFLAAFPYTDYEIELSALRDATVTVATETEPFAPVRVHAESLEDASTYRGLLPALVVKGKADIHERVQAGELEVEFVASEAVADAMTSGEHASLFRSQLEHPGFAVHVSESVPDFFLSLIDEELVQIGVMDDDGSPTAVLESTDPEVRSWADGLFEDRRAAAQPLTADAG